MLHAKFLQDLRMHFGSGEEDLLKVLAIYSPGGHLRHETWTIYINFLFPIPVFMDAPHELWL